LDRLAGADSVLCFEGRIAWDATADTPTLASAHETLLRTWQLDAGALEPQDKLELDVSMLNTTTKRGASALAWDPHHASQLAFALGGSVRTWDLRAKQDSVRVEDAHPSAALSLDFNPNKPYTLATGGDDGKLKFWDLRHARTPLLAFGAHSHWVWSTQYHPQHDQLVLSGGSDATVALWRVSSISSSPLVELDERDLMDETAGGAAVADTLIRRVEEHEEAVYAARWAAGGDAWMFASVSYDGRLAVNHVPSTEKYKILL
jgi:WD40 repeat protein